jgi:ribonuclease HI
MPHTLHIDGGARGNPGPAGVGVVIHNADQSEPVFEAGYYLGETTNNVAEYQGLIRGLEQALERGINDIQVISDSELVVKQIHRKYRVKAANLKPLFETATQLLGRFENWDVTHTRRENNKRADELANLAMDARADVTT